MSLREWLKQFIPMSSRSLNSRLDNLLIYMGEVEERLRTIEANSNELKTRLQILEANNNELKKLSYNHLDPGLYAHAVKQWYQDTTGNILDLDNPKTYNEKIQWMKVYDRDPRKTLLADKYLVRDWVKEKIGEEYLIPLLAVYRSAKEIDFDSLPDAFVLKANHGSGMNAIICNKQSENLEAIRSRAEGWLRQNFTFSYGYELQYNNIPRRIIVEKYMESHNGVMTELKVWCFSGKIGFLQIVRGTLEEKSHAFFDKDWNKTSFFTKILPLNNEDIPAPGNLSKIIQIAETLSSGFPFVRVDLYLLEDGTIKFGEMTFTPASGNVQWNSPEADKIIGNLLTLPEIS